MKRKETNIAIKLNISSGQILNSCCTIFCIFFTSCYARHSSITDTYVIFSISITSSYARYLYYYLSGAVCLSVCLSASVCVCKLFLLYGFGEQTSRILEFKPKGLDFQYLINYVEQLAFKLEKIIGIQKHGGKVRKNFFFFFAISDSLK